ncbi:PilN domain-containing protein [Actimicrobium sp. CCI2.3]|uniref:PilN domain-containing protein n=1 Tax=Actimicrobium sp. CCI2.3 TaxID=3048616 RepID=UPI002AB4927F|nr:PilN domain-containing protein [Actimicrobium sp. CCI2.3]MDY7573332.1 PilN domain-containing protein [Actimicrobium sp. CCI2.3]MEB0021729.1 PilN domain-containing protein [Actimicrobium sp. CCI2.3]
MIRINLLPHREERRKQRISAFIAMMGMTALVGALVVLLVGAVIANKISAQTQRNDYIKAENKKLDEEIKEIATLKAEIESLKARQQAVEDLQGDRNQPVYLMDELVKQVPEGVYLRAFKQEGQRVVLNGYAQSNERVSELLRNLGNNSAWLERPDLIEIRAANIGQGKDAKRVFDFTVNVGIKRPRDNDQLAGTKSTEKAAGPAPAVPVQPQ